jgi:UDP-N-acetylglucosamine 2-epimerase (non-hydrolysing)
MYQENKIKKLLFVVGTRPEAIKIAPLILYLQKHSTIDVEICSTGQHKKMLDGVLALFKLRPSYNLAIMKQGQDLTDISQKMLIGLKNAIKQSKPSAVVVHGDTTTSFIAALSAFYAKVDIFHLEAGLRTGTIKSPWPEEANRKLTAALADIHFAPTLRAKENLLAENILASKIFVTGNTVIDALHHILNQIKYDPALKQTLSQKFRFLDFNKKVILVTGHRRENHGEGIYNLCSALQAISKHEAECEIVFPVHLNPAVTGPVRDCLDNIKNIHLIQPLEYADFIYLMSKSYLIISDSGGIQEEAPSLGKPVLVTRETTERPEAVTAGTVKLVGTNTKKIIDTTFQLLQSAKEYEKMSSIVNPYGDGMACERILKIIKDEYFV